MHYVAPFQISGTINVSGSASKDDDPNWRTMVAHRSGIHRASRIHIGTRWNLNVARYTIDALPPFIDR